MRITKKQVAEKMLSYLEGSLPLPQLVDWAENALLEGEFRETEIDDLTQILGQIGLADVRAFGISWEDAHTIMQRLGYKLTVRAALAA